MTCFKAVRAEAQSGQYHTQGSVLDTNILIAENYQHFIYNYQKVFHIQENVVLALKSQMCELEIVFLQILLPQPFPFAFSRFYLLI